MTEEKNTPKKEVYKNSAQEYEGISEKKTSKLGYILLFIMGCFLFGVGETIFSDLSRIPEKPIVPSYCISSITQQNIENLSYLRCNRAVRFNAIDKSFGLDTAYESIKPILEKIIAVNSSLLNLRNQARSNQQNLERLGREYDLGLQEKMAGEVGIINKKVAQNAYLGSKNAFSNIEERQKRLESERTSYVSEIKKPLEALKEKYKAAQDHYKTVKAWYNLKVFVLTLIFILPFFSASVYYYLKFKRKNSPYTIILTAITTVSGILFLQVVGTFLYQILPKAFLTFLFGWIFEFAFLRYILYYGSVAVIIGIFGGLVYYIQKKVYSPKAVAIRRLKDGKCPGCSFPVNLHSKFCPDCGLQLKEECGHCTHLKIRYLAHCPTCGKE